MSSGAVVQVSRSALMALSAGAGSMYMYMNGYVPEGLSPKELGMFALKMGSNTGSNANDISVAMSPLALQLAEVNAELARMRAQNQYTMLSFRNNGISWTTVATVGAAGLVVLYWKGYSLSDIKWATQSALDLAVATLEMSIETLGTALETAKRELSYKLGLVEDKIEDSQNFLEAKITEEVGNARHDIQGVSNDIQGLAQSQDRVHGMVTNIETQMTSMEGRIDQQLHRANQGIYLLCNVVAEKMSTSNGKGGNSNNQSPAASGSSLYEELVSFTRNAMSSFRNTNNGAQPTSDNIREFMEEQHDTSESSSK